MIKKCPNCNSTKLWQHSIEKYWKCQRCGWKHDSTKADDFAVYHLGK